MESDFRVKNGDGMRYARKYLDKTPVQKIPKADRWNKNDPGSTYRYEVEHGIPITVFGFRQPIPDNVNPNNVYPRRFDQELFMETSANKVYFKFKRGFYKPNPKTLILSKGWLDKTRLLEIINRQHLDTRLLRIVKIGQYYWASDGEHRLVHRFIRGGSLPVMVMEKRWIA